jgi:metallo-beta-lactamase family protein
MLEGEKIQINAQAHTLSGHSAHADQKNLVNFVGRMCYKPKHIRIGDDDAKEALQRLYQQMLSEVVIGC